MPTPHSPGDPRRDGQPSAARQRMLARRRRTIVIGGLVVALGVGGWAAASLRGGTSGTPVAGPAVRVSAQPAPSSHSAAAGRTAPQHATTRRGAAHHSATEPRPHTTPTLKADVSRCDPAATACVDLGARITWLQHDGHITYGPVRSLPGVGKFATPTGTFQVAWKDRHHTSSEYGEPMPYAVFFAPGGIAFHEGGLHTPSHGCVHLTAKAAATYYAHLPVGAEVDVF